MDTKNEIHINYMVGKIVQCGTRCVPLQPSEQISYDASPVHIEDVLCAR